VKAPHPEIEARAIDAIRSASHFTASLFLGRGEYRVEKAETVFAAVNLARQIEHDAQGSRRALIYAIASDGYATLLTDALIDKLRTAMRAAQKGN
jgi:hypothetical protein